MDFVVHFLVYQSVWIAERLKTISLRPDTADSSNSESKSPMIKKIIRVVDVVPALFISLSYTYH